MACAGVVTEGDATGTTTTVSKCVKGLPAHTADIRVGDEIIEINGQDLTNLDHAAVMKLLRDGGTEINMVVIPGTPHPVACNM